MIANVVLFMLLTWFTGVLFITIRASADRRGQDALTPMQNPQGRHLVEEAVAPALSATEAGATQPEAPEAAMRLPR